jgi:hypothetical protein
VRRGTREAGGSIKPGVKRSETPGNASNKTFKAKARRAGIE